jgi:SAM-dependent methyltransferase
MTIENKYYQINADEFFSNTSHVDMKDLHENYWKYLKQGALILDAGCGSGRDTKAFKEKGYEVEAFDASSELVLKAKAFSGVDVKLSTFTSYETSQLFDGIWTCASLLHVPKEELAETILHLANYLVHEGYWYMSFKYGNSEREIGGRSFTDMDELTFSNLIKPMNLFTIEEMWVSQDKRADRSDSWLNIIIKKYKQ